VSFADEKDERPQRRAIDRCTCRHKRLGHAEATGPCYGCECPRFIPHPQPANDNTPTLQTLDWEGEFFRREGSVTIAYREFSAALARFDSSAPTEASVRALLGELRRLRSSTAALKHHLVALL
jgi:hypothetical protein